MNLSKFLNPKNDIAFKKIFGTEKNQNVLIRFINDILELKGNDQIQTVEFLSPIQDPEIAAKKQSIVDVLCKDNNGVTYIVEMQVAEQKGFEKRAQYYASKAYSRQLNKGDNRYDLLKEVIFIAIADYTLFPRKKDYISRHIILDTKSYEHDLKDFSFTFVELPKFIKPKEDKLETTTEQWCRFFKYADETTEEELERIIGSDLVIKQAYEAINQFNWNEQELFAYEQETKRIMDNQAVWDAAIEKAVVKAEAEGEARGEVRGVEKGKAEGKAEGLAEGEAKRNIKIAKNMIEVGISTTIISQITGLSIKEVEQLK